MSARNPPQDELGGADTETSRAERRFFARRSGSAETLVRSDEVRQLSPWHRALEVTISSGILLLVALSTANSIYIAGWVADMPDLRITAAVALIVGALGRIRRIPWPLGILFGVLLGALLIIVQVIQLESLGGQPVFWDRFTDIYYRFEDWFRQAFSAGLTTDNLPFVVFTAAFVWLAAFLGGYSMARWRNPWPALILLGALLAVNVSYLSDRQWNLSYGFFLTGAMLLLMRSALLRRIDRWRAEGTPYPDWISFSFVGITMIAIILLLSLSRGLPRPDESQALEDAWSTISDPFKGLNDDFRRLFSGIDSRRGVPVHSFDNFKVLQGDIDPGDGIVLRAAASEPGLLRGASYDRFTGRGWTQSPITVSQVDELNAISGELPVEPDQGQVILPQSSYLERRPVAAQISVERSPSVLFSFGAPVLANKRTRVESLAPTEFSVAFDAESAQRYADTDLAPVIVAINERIAAGESLSLSEVASYIPPRYNLREVRSEPGDEAPTGVDLSVEPEETDVLALRPTEERLRAGYTYQITGTVSGAPEASLRSAGADYPIWIRERFLQLPETLDEAGVARLDGLLGRIAVLYNLPRGGLGVAASGWNPYDIAAAVEAYLGTAPAVDENGRIISDDDGNPRPIYPLTTEIELPPAGVDVVSWFLFENVDDDGIPIGAYYDYHASAMAVLLRVAGVPARIATGYVLNENNYDDRTRNFVVRGHDAYTWVEVWFPDFGWVDFDPTPGTSVDETLAAIAGGGARIAAQRLSQPSIDLRPGQQNSLGADFTLDELLTLLSAVDPLAGSAAEQGVSKWAWLGPTIALAVIVGLVLLAALSWRLSLHGLGTVERAWTGTSRLARWSGIEAAESVTPLEHAARIDAALGAEQTAERLAHSYAAVRYSRGGAELAPPEHITPDWKQLRTRLLRRLFRLPNPRIAQPQSEEALYAPDQPS